MRIQITTLLVVSMAIATGCEKGNSSPADEKKKWPLENVPTKPAEIVVESGTKFKCGGVPCRLLGVKESADPAIRKKAVDFTSHWFHGIGNYIGIYNESNPLVAEDGTTIVWVRGYDSSLSCLNELLVREGLAEIDDSSWKDYSFLVPVKGIPGGQAEDWQGILRKAKESHDRDAKK